MVNFDMSAQPLLFRLECTEKAKKASFLLNFNFLNGFFVSQSA